MEWWLASVVARRASELPASQEYRPPGMKYAPLARAGLSGRAIARRTAGNAGIAVALGKSKTGRIVVRIGFLLWMMMLPCFRFTNVQVTVSPA